MGIQGLIPFLKKSSRPINIKEFQGCTVAVDTYCWLHKGAFSCADKLVKGEKTDGYVFYCMKMVNSLLSYGVQPIMVFDGQRLPSKLLTESKRHENRLKYKKKAREFLIQGKLREARECFQRCTEVTSEMAHEVIKACRRIGVDCIVAPYEADAQLAYLSKIGIVQLVITEDSDLILFGCERIVFKLDVTGNGLMIENSKIHLSLGIQAENYTFDKFRYMCIMSGCDYLQSLPGIGLGKACKFFSKVTNPNIDIVLTKIPVYLNMSNIVVTKEYIENFIKANNTFLHQLVFDPLHRRIVPLTPYPSDYDRANMEYAGPLIPDDLAYEIALGNVSVDNLKKVDNFNPDKDVLKMNSKRKSIWDPLYKFESNTSSATTLDRVTQSHMNIPDSKKSKPSPKLISTPKHYVKILKRHLDDVQEEKEIPTDQELINMYGDFKPPKRCKFETDNDEKSKEVPEAASPSVVVYSRFFAPPSIPKLSVRCNNDIEDDCKMETKLNKSLNDAVAQDTDTNSNKGAFGQRKGSLFFDVAVASKSFKTSNDSSLKTSPLSSITSSQACSFGNWNNLRKHFSYPMLSKLEDSPKNHTDFKPVVCRSKYFDCLDKSEDEAKDQLNVDDVNETDGKSSEMCSVSDSCSLPTAASEADSVSSESSDVLCKASCSGLEPPNSEVFEEQTTNVSHFFMKSVLTTNEVLKPVVCQSRNSSLKRISSSQENKTGKCKVPGLSRFGFTSVKYKFRAGVN